MSQTKFLKLGRTFNEGAVNFYRNGWLSFATVSVLAISLYIISITVFIGFAGNIVMKNIQDKINVSVYFKSTVPEQQILEIKSKLSVYEQIKSINYISKETALNDFLQKEKDNKAISRALEVIDGNPFNAYLVIQAKNPNDYGKIEKAISDSSYNEFIDKINYKQNQEAIERLGTIIKIVQQVGTTMGIVFIFIGILITFNAIRLTMYAQKQEFEVKRLVGASNLYIRMPFVFEGIFYGLASATIVMILLAITSKFISPLTQDNMPEGNIMGFYLGHFFTIYGLLLLSGVFLGVISGVIAIRKYLKI